MVYNITMKPTNRQKETEKGDGVDEQTGKDEIDDVEETASFHVYGESDIRVRLVTTRVDALIAFHRHHVHEPLLVLRARPPVTDYDTHKSHV